MRVTVARCSRQVRIARRAAACHVITGPADIFALVHTALRAVMAGDSPQAGKRKVL